MSQNAKKIGGAVVTVILVAIAGVSAVRGNNAKDAYNEFSTGCRQALADQDALIDEIQTDIKPGKIAGWIERAEDIQARIEAVPAKTSEIEPLKGVLVERAQSLSEAMRTLKALSESEDEAEGKRYGEEYGAKCELAGKKLEEFVALRDAYFKKHDLSLE